MLKFFGTQKLKPRAFNYKPRFYDADKEELEQRIKRRLADDDSEMIKLRLRREFSYNKSAPKGGLFASSSFRIVLIMILLVFFSYLVLENLLPQLMEFWFPEEVERAGEEFY